MLVERVTLIYTNNRFAIKGWRVNKIISRSSLSTPHSLSSVRLVHYKYGSEEALAACCGPSSALANFEVRGAGRRGAFSVIYLHAPPTPSA